MAGEEMCELEYYSGSKVTKVYMSKEEAEMMIKMGFVEKMDDGRVVMKEDPANINPIKLLTQYLNMGGKNGMQ